ncbi:MAG: DUF885 family protein [Gemmatimonadales bacterium]|jgi:hypothetical protein|nr:DUF885 family protein [Gemmatimonadales bacterium]MBT6886910.1 DUF885 family protein [Gemmatimonadales bacterium]MBT7125520.1 DUF885 family protein [Gemmatimonadales bacterium]MBT7503891.1 DUF885 family protein [Gemmatimonadales bacterium]MDG2239319.1 DUF885 family protein [Longimicrobiales bacterium]
MTRTLAVTATLLMTGFVLVGDAQAQSDAGWDDLVALDSELSTLRRPHRQNGVPQFGPGAMASRAQSITDVQAGLASLDATNWSVSGKVDYLLVWAKANGMEFEHRVTRPWQRDPILYLDQVRRVPYIDLPLTGEAASRWRESLEAVPELLRQAEANLDDASGELAGLAMFHLDNFDGVGQGQPYRDEPPGGTIAWFADLCERVEESQSQDAQACEAALEAVVGYRDWLVAEQPGMRSSAGIGSDNLEWYFRNVRLLPYGVTDIVLLGEREFHRYRAAYEIVRNRNARLPELELTRSAEQHEARTREAERQTLALIREQELLTLPDDLPDAFDSDTFWSPRALTDRHFWEELQFRNALNNHIHASVPGHRFDGLLARAGENPIRRGYGDSSRAEGWATYIEEMFVLAGLTRDVPRADELFYVALMKRASRIYAEASMHAGSFSLDEANRYMIDFVPYMEEDLGRYDLEGYLRRPGSGSGYMIGKIQLEKMLSEQALELGDDFKLGAFHDEVLSRGMIPLTLIRWEMTGADDEVRTLWQAATGGELGR